MHFDYLAFVKPRHGAHFFVLHQTPKNIGTALLSRTAGRSIAKLATKSANGAANRYQYPSAYTASFLRAYAAARTPHAACTRVHGRTRVHAAACLTA